MSNIKVLPLDVRNKIAAGEVIERPASVVKELVENSIDAGSTEIRIDILSAGRRMIRVTDNGSGMDRDDAMLCFEPHATSKLSTADDLFDIRTMGFRGEALPSIASISKVKLVSGLRNAGAGLEIEIEGGTVTGAKEAASSGTMIEIRDLFYNTPARKKFLKSPATELSHIIETVTQEALSHPAVAFSLYTDNKETMLLPVASGLRERIMQIYGDEFLKGLVEINTTPGNIRMDAFVSDTTTFRNSRDHQHLFINRRPVKDKSISHAVYKAYEGILPHDRHPVFFVFLEIDPAQVDFNVHPAKREVRFGEKEVVYRFLLGSIRSRIRDIHAVYTKPFSMAPSHVPSSVWPAAYPAGQEQTDRTQALVSEGPGLAYRPSLPFIYLGDTFIAVSGRGGLTLVDHHAAHERILYEKLLNRVEVDAHQLLFPEQVRLSHKEYLSILENREVLGGFGIEVDDFGHDTVIVRSLPDALAGADIRGILADVASAVAAGVPPDRSLREALAARIACHGSVRGRQILNAEEVSALLHDLDRTDSPDQCPHGRPTRLFYTIEDLQKLFKRK
ncbi:MAG: DNA mismatch repair endonuclease MutL [Nitrospiraceae bacterium]|nr:DNA mismatch repair endonuclease MutL [Nitrospiraceae bacterium]